jgi:hypothetical protein
VAAVALAAVIAPPLLVDAPQPAQAAPPGPVLPDMMDRDTIKAIDAGLNYLAKTQRANGSWMNSGGYGYYPSVMSSLAGMAFMAGGSTPESGPYSRNVSKAMNYILRHVAEASNDGLIASDMESQSMYGHGFSMLFLAQCYGMDLSPEYEARLKTALEKAVQITAKAQSDLGKQLNNAGGWTYTPGGGDEGSVTVTQLQALRACRNVGIKVPKSTIDRAVAYLKHCQMPNGGICYSAQSRGDSRPAISAAAVACFYAAGVYDRASGGQGEEAQMVEKLVSYCKGTVRPGSGGDGHAFYTQYYMSQAMYQRGGKDWHEYYPQLKRWLLSTQAPDGSWNGDGVGTTYGTAMACVMLQLPYGYLPIYQR